LNLPIRQDYSSVVTAQGVKLFLALAGRFEKEKVERALIGRE
jgi:hypothetical protein